MIDLSLGEAEALAVRIARAAGFSWGHAEDVGRAARMLATRGAPWGEALRALARLAGGFQAPSPERATRWRCGQVDVPSAAPLCPILTAVLLIDSGIVPERAPLRLKRLGLPIWLQGLLWTAGATTRQVVEHGASEALSPAADVTISTAARVGEEVPARRARLEPELLAELLSIAAQTYVPESDRSRARGAGGGGVDAE